MEVHIRHTPSAGVARVLLSPGESVLAEQSAMLACSFGLNIMRQGRGGVRSADKSAPAVFAASAEGGWIDLAPDGPGDVYPLRMAGESGWCVARGTVLARPDTVRPDPNWKGFAALFGAEGGFLERYVGSGELLLTCAGPVDAFALEPGELISVSPGYLLAYPDTMQCRLRAIDPAGPQSLRSGEGLLLDFAGPGTLYTRARRPQG